MMQSLRKIIRTVHVTDYNKRVEDNALHLGSAYTLHFEASYFFPNALPSMANKASRPSATSPEIGVLAAQVSVWRCRNLSRRGAPKTGSVR